jgi:hypothetical protein
MNTVSAESKVLAAFTFVAALLFGGWNGVVLLAVRLLGNFIPGDRGAVAGMVVAALALGALLVARNGATASTAMWAKQLGGATAILALLVIVASAAFVLGNIIGVSDGILNY